MPKRPILNPMGCSWATGHRAALEVGGLEMGSWGRANSIGGRLQVVVEEAAGEGTVGFYHCCSRSPCHL